MCKTHPTFSERSHRFHDGNAMHCVNTIFAINTHLIFVGLAFARTADTRFIRAMVKPWSKLMER